LFCFSVGILIKSTLSNLKQLSSTQEVTLNVQLPRQFYEDLVQSYIADFGIYSKAQRNGRSSYFGKNREHSLPLITGDGFRMISDLFIDEPS
jgi:hypothetical protein